MYGSLYKVYLWKLYEVILLQIVLGGPLALTLPSTRHGRQCEPQHGAVTCTDRNAGGLEVRAKP